MHDKVKVVLQSGKGGDGAIAFRREKSVERGGPYGGNGGRGGSIYLVADNGINSLSEYRFGKVVRAEDGENGRTKLQYGKDAADIYLHVPVGTVILDVNNKQLADLYIHGQTYLAVKGGRGGRGNACFKSSTKRTPNIAENGMPGVEKTFYFELKLIADVGLVGFPNVGKSTFLDATTRAHPNIADYPFTTLEPQLGVVYIDNDKSFVLADIPGLIEGASEGKGLGYTFLRHIERCRVLLHIVDLTSENLIENFEKINHELYNFSPDLLAKPMVVALNKSDLEYDKGEADKFIKYLGDKYKIYTISAKDNTGTNALLKKLYQLVSMSKADEKDKKEKAVDIEEKVYSAKDIDNGRIPLYNIVKRSDGYYEIIGERVIRTKQLINLKTDEGIDRLNDYLDRIGVNDRLKEMNVEDGSTILLDDFEFEYYE